MQSALFRRVDAELPKNALVRALHQDVLLQWVLQIAVIATFLSACTWLRKMFRRLLG